MRFRVTATAFAGATALLLGLPVVADAATGTFAYQYEYRGHTFSQSVGNPTGGKCLRLALPDSRSAAYRVENRADAAVVVFTDGRCQTPARALAPGQSAPAKILVRSIMYSS